MMKFFRDNRGATLVEFALVTLPVFVFILGIMQTAWIVWIDNSLQVSVDAAARCGAVKSTTLPCEGDSLANMISTANRVFRPLSGATFTDATITPPSTPACTNGKGLVGSYTISLVFVVNLTVTAKSCYPAVVVSPA